MLGKAIVIMLLVPCWLLAVTPGQPVGQTHYSQHYQQQCHKAQTQLLRQLARVLVAVAGLLQTPAGWQRGKGQGRVRRCWHSHKTSKPACVLT